MRLSPSNLYSLFDECKSILFQHETFLIRAVIPEHGERGGVVVKALRYIPVGRGFNSRWCHWNFLVTQSFRSHYGPGVDSASNRNEYQVYFLGVKADGV